MPAPNRAPRETWLIDTPQLDIKAPKLRTRTLSITQLCSTEQEKTVALHNFVQRMPFGSVADYSTLTAADVLKLGYGDCFTKGTLFVAMLRCAGIRARMRFVSLPTRFLRGIVEMDEPSIMHAMAEVLVKGRWVTTDSYVPDPVLFAAAHKRLTQEKQSLGYGIHIAGTQCWEGKHNASAQSVISDRSSLPVVDWGIAHDPVSFYSDPSHQKLRRNFVTRLKWRLASPVVNKRVAMLRATV